jgi:hypothetical protein
VTPRRIRHVGQPGRQWVLITPAAPRPMFSNA